MDISSHKIIRKRTIKEKIKTKTRWIKITLRIYITLNDFDSIDYFWKYIIYKIKLR